ncbi:BspC domain-containing protein [Paraburkholderia hayleyella]|uniref:BspC domain-containing protein n=1 Tax=Paraburkholderia hayleyella TaxID=2152889 RepID=UPI001290E218|nr:hypothetical protein [Paraburkholderia hayleyella]
MDHKTRSHHLLHLAFQLVMYAASASLLFTTPVFADQIEQHNELTSKFIDDMSANPLVADCAAHANFVASTSSAFDHVEFPPGSFDSSRASVTPWNDSFDEGKQRIKVDSIVTVAGLGIPQNGGTPANLEFRCGYVGNQMLAFSWNDPVPPAKPRSTVSSSKKKKSVKNRHATNHKAVAKRSKNKSSSKAATPKSRKKTPAKKKS